MKRFLITLISIISLTGAALSASVKDTDGVLSIRWNAPVSSYGDTLTRYSYTMTVNGVMVDSGSIASNVTQLNNFDTLRTEGDWAVFRLRSVASPGNYSVSPYSVSDTVIYDTETGINPPTNLQWIVH